VGGMDMQMMDIIKGRRTIRKYQQKKIDRAILEDLVDGARLAPSASNRQPLEYLVVDDPGMLDKVFETLSWAGYIRPEGNPKEGEKPVAYIIVLINKELGVSNPHKDCGAAIQNILLGAYSYGIGTCWIGSVNRKQLRENLSIPDKYEIDDVVALGYPAEESVWEEEKGSIKYYKDENKVLHVPKRKLDSILHFNGV